MTLKKPPSLLSPRDLLPIGELARRTGLSVSAIRFYEDKGLIAPMRNNGGQRRFFRSDIRRLSFVLIARKLGLTLREIEQALASLPHGRTPTRKDWTKISRVFHKELEAQIIVLERMRDNLDGCVGCGCLSLKKCALYNPQDEAGQKGAGPRRVLAEG